MKKKLFTQYSFIDFTGMIIFLLLCSGFIMNTSGFFKMSILLILFSILFIKNMKHLTLDENMIIIIFLIFLNIVLTAIFNDIFFKTLIFDLGLLVMALLFVSMYKFDKTIILFCDVMYFLAICSLITYFIALLLPGIIMKFPVVYNYWDQAAYNTFVSVIPVDGLKYGMRNYGLFWEPGAFQTYINLAFIFTLFFIKRHNLKYFLVYGLAIVTTMSTAGYIVFAATMFYYFINSLFNNSKVNKKKIFIQFFILGVGIVAILSYLYVKFPYEIQKIFGKFSTDHVAHSTTSIRMDSFLIPLKEFIKYPFLGRGYENLKELMEALKGHSLVICTPINWLAFYGAGGFIYLFGLYNITSFSSNHMINKVIIYILILLTMISENYVNNPSIIIFCLYGYVLKGNRYKLKLTQYINILTPRLKIKI